MHSLRGAEEEDRGLGCGQVQTCQPDTPRVCSPLSVAAVPVRLRQQDCVLFSFQSDAEHRAGAPTVLAE